MLLVSDWGGTASNSYIDLVEANSLAPMFFDSEYFTNASSADQVRALIRATQDIDDLPYLAPRRLAEQRLKFPISLEPWPRTQNVEASSPYSVDEQFQIEATRKATLIQAIFILKNRTRPDILEMQNKGIVSFGGGGGNVSKSVGMTLAGVKLCLEAQSLLRKWRGSGPALIGR